MSDLNFSQPERRSFFVPILLAVVAIVIAVGVAIHFFPATSVDLVHVRTEVLPIETLFKSNTVIGLSEANHMVFIASTVKVDNHLRVPIYLDDFHITLTDPSGAEMTVSADTPKDLPDLEANYPGIKPLMTTPLVRNTGIDSEKSAEGTLLFALSIPKSVWDARKSAVIKVDLYHQPPMYVTLPQ